MSLTSKEFNKDKLELESNRLQHVESNVIDIVVDQDQHKICRICFEGTDNQECGKLIAPCSCKGSVGYVHDTCLKNWMLLRSKCRGSIVKCELCDWVFNMNIEITENFSFLRFKTEGWKSFISSFVLIFAMFGVTWMIWMMLKMTNIQLQDILSEGPTSTHVDEKLAAFVFIGAAFCLFLNVVLGVSVYHLIKEAFVQKVVRWDILDNLQEHTVDENVSIQNLEKLKVFIRKEEQYAGIFFDKI